MKNYFNEADEKLKWTQQSSKSLLKTVVFDVTENHNVSANGVSGDYYIMDAPDWVIVIPEIDNCFLMVKQWRHGEKNLSVEFPGGIIDEGEAPETAAARELKEETGFSSDKLIKLGSVNPNPALFSNHVHVYLAQDLCKTGEQQLDFDEFINCIKLTQDEVLEGMGTEQFSHGLMSMAMCLYLKYVNKNK